MHELFDICRDIIDMLAQATRTLTGKLNSTIEDLFLDGWFGDIVSDFLPSSVVNLKLIEFLFGSALAFVFGRLMWNFLRNK